MKIISEFIASLLAIFTIPAMVGTPTPTPEPGMANHIEWQNETISYNFYKLNGGHLELIPNYENQDTVKNIAEINRCVAGINGGFYDTENKPLGLVVSNNVMVKKLRPSSLFNGYAVVKNDKSASVEKNYQNDWLHAVQTGPVLVWDGNPTTLSLSRDKPARRMVFIQERSDIYLLAVYKDTQMFDGAYLKDMPEIVSRIGEVEGWKIVNAINLDGGSASAFISPKTSLSELSPIGSFWCVRKD